MTTANQIPSVNYHLWKPCNMRCEFCFATFQDINQAVLPKGHLGREDCMSVVDLIVGAGFKKLNFAGGEPTLCPWLPDLITRAKALGSTTAIVTNGSYISEEWMSSVRESLDWVALSIDSVDPVTLLRTGRVTRCGPMTQDDYLRVIGILKSYNVRVKINTVVTQANVEENLVDFIIRAHPERWKILQVLPVKGQNDSAIGDYLISAGEFERFVRVHCTVASHGITVVPENNDLMTGSYVMVDPAGRFFDNVAGAHTYSRPILEVGVEEALKDVSVDAGKFLSRSGVYAW